MANDLLSLLDNAVQRTARRRDLAGRIAIGVKTPDGPRWWIAELGEATKTSFADTIDKVDAAMLLESESVTAPSHIFGDRALLQRVLDHYLGKTDLLSVRSSGNESTRGRKKRPRR